ncbi:MAG: HD-GYP domain-containing protein [Lachnospiraceae bacterium]|nr:HD-GYP domain-containing protein [Lachnospiraceae bacterium]
MINVNSPKDDKEYKSRHLGMTIMMVFLLIAAFSASIFVSSVLFNRSTREYRQEILNKAAKLASEHIDADKIDHWLENGADDSYIETANMLQSICNNTPYVQYLYVYQIRPDGCHVVFDLETNADDLDQYDEIPEVSTEGIGEIVEFEESFYDVLPTLLEGGQIDIIESKGAYGWLLTKYEPIFDSAGKCAAYVGVDLSMLGVKDYNQTFLKWIVAISALFLLALILAGYQYFIYARKADEYNESEQRRIQQGTSIEQLADAMIRAIYEKDRCRDRHSYRVAEYSKKIAEEIGKNKNKCEQVYYAALLHDVGMIGVPREILTKEGRLTDEEFAHIKEHPVLGGDILSKISQYPWLSLGARYHHERYDGKGYPEGRKGTDIPEIARIIAVADAYDAMTSDRSYRKAMSQQDVREEFVKGTGTQFDPGFAKIMIQLIDRGVEL